MLKKSDPAGLLILLLPIVFVKTYVPFASSNDLFATWMAGVMFDAGQFDQIYNATDKSFTMLAPASWADIAAQRLPRMTELYPFLYPPLWAALASFTADWDFEVLVGIAQYLNITLMMATIALAYRSFDHTVPLPLFAVIGIATTLGTFIGLTALHGNQPQILVSFLIVLSVERATRGALIAAGIALALAASLKLYPALFAVFFLALSQRRAFVSFVTSGAILAATSVAIAGWPLHLLFLQNLAQITDTVLITRINLTPDATIAQLFFATNLQDVFASETSTGPAQWLILGKSSVWAILSKLALLTLITALFVSFRTRGPAVWPAAVTIISMLTPVAWIYYFIPAACFAPLLMHRLGHAKGGVLILICFAPLSYLTTTLFPQNNPLFLIDQITRMAAMGCFGILFWITAHRPIQHEH
jgi:hypothetical protein